MMMIAGTRALTLAYYSSADCRGLLYSEEVEEGACIAYSSGSRSVGTGLNVPSAFQYCMTHDPRPALALFACPYVSRGIDGWGARFERAGDDVRIYQAYGGCDAPAYLTEIPFGGCNQAFDYSGSWNVF